MYEEALRAGELVSLPWDHPYRQLFVRQVRAGQLQRLVEFGLVDIDGSGRVVETTSLQFLDRFLGCLVFGFAWCVVIGGHFRVLTPWVIGTLQCVTHEPLTLCPIRRQISPRRMWGCTRRGFGRMRASSSQWSDATVPENGVRDTPTGRSGLSQCIAGPVATIRRFDTPCSNCAVSPAVTARSWPWITFH